jgi:hypothetical protein
MRREGPAAAALRAVLRGCLAAAMVAVAVSAIAGYSRAGIAIAAGLAIGSVNGHLALRSLASDASFRITSLGRLGILSAAGVGVGLLLGADVAYFTIAGLAVAQLILAAAAAYQVAHS